ncbi:DNA repair protein REV1 isoform X2 [Myripristis murdjan]|uniref:DNA repair protein REV1 n=1 Tax=Myripristis murdjan TaxID=586833 RepID=A0A667Z2P9_9TELE|nr:DNA repair protein REV1 isoform X2 [Myripristis murdjan]
MSRDGWAKKRANANDDNGWASRGGYMAAKISKLDEQFKLDAPREKQKDGACSSIFSGVSIYVNGYTEPSADELRRLMMLHGGQFHVYYSRSKTTHIIANNLPNCKIQELKGEKVVRPEWITDSIKAGHILPYLQYQLYAKQKGLSFPGVNLRQAQETAGPSHGLLQPSFHQNLQPPQGSVQRTVLNHEQSFSSRHNNSIPSRSHNQLHPGNFHPQSTQRSPAARFISPQPGHLASIHPGPQHRHLSTEPRHYSPALTHPLPKSSPVAHLHKQPQSSLMPPHASLQHRKLGQPQPQTSLSCNPLQSSCRELEVKLNGSLQTSLDLISHSKRNGAQEWGSEDLCPVRAPQGVKEVPLTNGHTHSVNGALKPEDLSPITDQSPVDKDLPQCRLKSLESKPVSPPVENQMKPDPYDFPHSPPKQPNQSPVSPHQQSPQAANEQRPKHSPPTDQKATVATESHPLPPQPQQSCQFDFLPEKTKPSPALHSLSHSPVRLNGSHHNAFSPDPVSPKPNNLSASNCPPDSPADKSSTSKSSAQLLAQTGGLISEFYSRSRYHQISTWRSGFSEYVNELHSRRRTAGGATFTGKDRLRKSLAQRSTDSQGSATSAPMSVKSCILHVDMDCFFVSVGIRHRPELKGKPVAVTSNRGQGRVAPRPGANPQLEQQYYERRRTGAAQPESMDWELETTPSPESPVSHANGVDQDTAALSMAEIASCSYEARQAGVRNGMFFGKAKQLCPSLQSVPYDFEAYKDVALTMYEILASYTHDIEALSCDEVLIDGSALLSELGIGPDDLAKAIRAEIKEKTGCSASVGMGSNILLARLATRKAKPDGQYFLRSEEVDDFIRDLSVTSLPGVGPVMGSKLATMGVRTCGDLQQVSLSQLQKAFGPRTGQTLFRFCRGLDDRLVRYEKERKSVSAEMNYNIRFTGVDEAECFLTNLSMEVQKRLKESGLRGRRVTLKVMVRKAGAPVEPAKYGGHGICNNLARTAMLAQSTDSGQLIASAVIKLFHAMKLQVQDLRGVGIQVQLLEGNHSVAQDSTGSRSRSIKDMLLGQGLTAQSNSKESNTTVTAADTAPGKETTSSTTASFSGPSSHHLSPAEPVPGTSKEQQPAPQQTPKHARARLNFSIEVPSPSQVDRSVLEALPAELREQVEQSWTHREGRTANPVRRSPSPQPPQPPPQPPPLQSRPASPPPPPPASGPLLFAQPLGTLVLQIPNQPGQTGPTGIVLELPHFSQVDPDVFAALPKELQEELRSAYSRIENVQPQGKILEQKNPLLQLKQSGVGVGIGRVKRRYKRKNAGSPVKKGPSPVKRHNPGNSPAKTLPSSVRPREMINGLKTENGPSTSSSKQDIPESLSKFIPRPAPALAGACDLTDIRTLLREWVTTISEPMEEDILQVVKYCTDLIEDKDLEKLDLIIKYMKRLMQQSVESVWSMAFDFIVDNVQVVVQQAYGSTLKIT